MENKGAHVGWVLGEEATLLMAWKEGVTFFLISPLYFIHIHLEVSSEALSLEKRVLSRIVIEL